MKVVLWLPLSDCIILWMPKRGRFSLQNFSYLSGDMKKVRHVCGICSHLKCMKLSWDVFGHFKLRQLINIGGLKTCSQSLKTKMMLQLARNLLIALHRVMVIKYGFRIYMVPELERLTNDLAQFGKMILQSISNWTGYPVKSKQNMLLLPGLLITLANGGSTKDLLMFPRTFSTQYEIDMVYLIGSTW